MKNVVSKLRLMGLGLLLPLAAVAAPSPADCPAGSNIILGTAGADTRPGTNGLDCIFGFAGDDVIKDCWDNAVAESFFDSMKSELIHRHVWPTRKRARKAVGEYVEAFYNTCRLHSTLGYLCPVEFEEIARKELALAA